MNLNKEGSGEYPKNILELREKCSNFSYLDQYYRYTPGAYFSSSISVLPIEAKLFPAVGTYGIQRIDLRSGHLVARSGFDIDEEEQLMVISHTPQGVNPQVIGDSSIRNRLGRSNFRQEMMGHMVKTARSIGLKRVVGIPADWRRGLIVGPFNWETGMPDLDYRYKVVDAPFINAGFLLNWETGLFELAV